MSRRFQSAQKCSKWLFVSMCRCNRITHWWVGGYEELVPWARWLQRSWKESNVSRCRSPVLDWSARPQRSPTSTTESLGTTHRGFGTAGTATAVGKHSLKAVIASNSSSLQATNITCATALHTLLASIHLFDTPWPDCWDSILCDSILCVHESESRKIWTKDRGSFSRDRRLHCGQG